MFFFCKRNILAGQIGGSFKHGKSPCLCAPSGEFCVAYDGTSKIVKIWEFLSGEPEEEDAEFLEAMGFQVSLSKRLNYYLAFFVRV